MKSNQQPFSKEKAMELANSDAGKQFLAFLQKNKGDELQKAMALAAKGNMEEMKKAVSSLLSDQQAQALFNQLRNE